MSGTRTRSSWLKVWSASHTEFKTHKFLPVNASREKEVMLWDYFRILPDDSQSNQVIHQHLSTTQRMRVPVIDSGWELERWAELAGSWLEKKQVWHIFDSHLLPLEPWFSAFWTIAFLEHLKIWRTTTGEKSNFRANDRKNIDEKMLM